MNSNIENDSRQQKNTEIPKNYGKARMTLSLKQYVCEFCGIYVATRPRCNKCEEER